MKILFSMQKQIHSFINEYILYYICYTELIKTKVRELKKNLIVPVCSLAIKYKCPEKQITASQNYNWS